ncbi:MAG TPA: SIMPL domain-containing protein [Lapillicoccus sp.]|nr:SIMPL domain-containing protein [Lapillicoccus sp.]
MAKNRRIVQVTGSGKASATPDVVRLALGVTCDGDDVSSALREVGARVQAIGEAARAQDVRGNDISSTGAGVHPRYDRDGQRVVGYQANHRLGILVRDVERVGAVVDAVAGVAGNSLSVDSIQLDLSDVSALQDEARSAAFLDARAKAAQYAALSDAPLGEVLSVVEGAVAGGPPRPMMRMAMASADSAMPVEAGEQSVTASVTVTWSLAE